MNDPSNISEITDVGFIGLGQMGLPMCGNLMNAGLCVTVWNRSANKCDRLVEQGARLAKSPANLAASGVQAICLNLSDTASVEMVLFGDNGLADALQAGQLVIDHSTIESGATAQFASRLQKLGVGYIDAPVSGGVGGAQAGTLSIMVGGEEADVSRCIPLLNVVGKRIVHLGPAGSGQSCKAANQIAAACALMGVCEALAFARKSNLPMTDVLDVLTNGAANSVQLEKNGSKIVSGSDAPGFKMKLFLKDLEIALAASRDIDLPLLSTSTVAGYLRSLVARGRGDEPTYALAASLEMMGNFSFASSGSNDSSSSQTAKVDAAARG